MAGLHGGFSGGMTTLMMAPTEEFQEEDLWGLMSKGSSSFRIRKSKSGPASIAWRSATTPTAIPRSGPATDGVGLKDLRSAPKVSSPMEVPDWSKILKEGPKRTWWDDEVDDDDRVYACGDEDDVDVCRRKPHHAHDSDDDDMLPPHEFLARRIRRTQVAYSMCEGIGRTLKGRDLSNLRNAILAKTGFLE